MEFDLLTWPEFEQAKISEDVHGTITSEMIAAAARRWNFSEEEVRDMSLFTLDEDYQLLPDLIYRRGARALIGINGITLIETPSEPAT